MFMPPFNYDFIKFSVLGDTVIVGDTSDTSEVVKTITWASIKTLLSSVFATALGADDNYVTDAEKVKLSNLSGTNTGDQTNITGNAATVTTNANLTGHVTSVGNAAVLGSFTKAQLSTAVSDGDPLYVGDISGVSDGDKGDITVSASGATWTIDNGVVSLAKMANLAQDQFIGRTTASTGVPETTTITSAARTVLDDTTVGDMVNTIGGATSTGTGGLVRIAGSTLTGTTTVDRIDYDRAVGGVNAIGNLGATETIDWSTHTHYTGTLDSNITFTYSNQVSGQVVTLYLTYSGAQRTITWPTTTWLDNASGAAPTAPAASGNVLVVTLSYVGTTTFASATGNYVVYA